MHRMASTGCPCSINSIPLTLHSGREHHYFSKLNKCAQTEQVICTDGQLPIIQERESAAVKIGKRATVFGILPQWRSTHCSSSDHLSAKRVLNNNSATNIAVPDKMTDAELPQDLKDIYNRGPKDDELWKLSRCVGDWWPLAKELRLDDAEVERIKEDYKNALERCYQALRTWRNKYYGTNEGKVGFLVVACKQASVD